MNYEQCTTQYAIRNTRYENRESSYLRAYKTLHLSRTLYKSALFIQNKPNLLDAQMNVTIYLQMAYENIANWTLGQNKPNSNPIAERVKLMQSVYLQRIIKKIADKGYKKTKPKQTQFQKRQKMNEKAFLQKDYENETAIRPQKNKPKQTQFQTGAPANCSDVASLLTKYRWKIMPAAAIFNQIKKLTIARTGANLKYRKVI